LPLILLVWLVGTAAIIGIARAWLRSRVMTSIAYAGLVLALHGPALLGLRLQIPTDIAYQSLPWSQVENVGTPLNPILTDVTFQMLPFHTLVRDRLLHGEMPLWAPEFGTGQPLLGNAQSAAFAPLHLLTIPLEPIYGLTVAVSWQTLLSLILMQAFLEGLGCGLWSAAFGALSYSLSLFAVCWAYHPHGMAMAWIPGILLALLMLRRGLRGGLSGLIGCTTGLLLSGHPETTLIGAIAILVFFVDLLRQQVPETSRFLAKAAFGWLLAGMLAAPAIIPLLDAIAESTRNAVVLRNADLVQPPPFEPRFAALALDPLYLGSPRDDTWSGPSNFNELCSGYAGFLTLAFAIAGTLRRRAWAIVLALGVAALLVAIRVPPFFDVVRHVPILGTTPLARLRLLFVLAVSITGALGAHDITATKVGRKRLLAIVVALSCGLLVLHPRLDPWSVAWMVAALTGAAVAVVVTAPRVPIRAAQAALAVALGCELVALTWRYQPLLPATLSLPSTDAIDVLRNARLAAPSPFRIVGTLDNLPPNLASLFGLWDLRGNDPIAPARASYIAGRSMRPHYRVGRNPYLATRGFSQPLLDFLAVRFVLSSLRERMPPPWQLEWQGQRARIWENPQHLELFFVPHRIDLAGDPVEATIANEHPDEVAYAAAASTESPRQQNGNVTVQASRNGVALEVQSDQGVLVASSVSFDAGWRAMSAGERLGTVRINGGFLGVRVPPGARQVVLDFRPRYWRLSLALSSLAAILLIAWWWHQRKPRVRRPLDAHLTDAPLVIQTVGEAQAGQPPSPSPRSTVTGRDAIRMLHRMRRIGSAVVGLLLFASPSFGSVLGCAPCGGVRLSAPDATPLPDLLTATHLTAHSPLFIAWDTDLSGANPASAEDAVQRARTVDANGGTPWIGLVFHTPEPVTKNLAAFGEELRAAADLAAGAPAGSYFQVLWRPNGVDGPIPAASYAFVLKRAAVALTGAQARAKVITAPVPYDPAWLTAFYAEDVAAYFEIVALEAGPGDPTGAQLGPAISALAKLDPGRPIAVDSLPYPDQPGDTLSTSARMAAAGVDLTLYRTEALDLSQLAPLAVLAREFAGDLSADPGEAPKGGGEAWAFVRGNDLALRVIATTSKEQSADPAATLSLHFTDVQLRRPTRFPYVSGNVPPPTGKVTADGLDVEIASPGPVVLLGFERATTEETGGVAEKVTVSGQHEITVDEILRKLQAFESAQARKVDHYSAVNTTHMRFQIAGSGSVETTFQGPMFWTPQTGADWAWETLYINGVRWRSKKLPEIPLIQPEKAAALPLEIELTRQYRYALRGSEEIDGRRAWIIDFAPAGAAGDRGKLYRGTVWVDQQVFCRLKSRAVQLGLNGEVSSNEETLVYSPVDDHGGSAAWTAQTFVMPLHLLAEQILSVLNEPTVVERETFLTELSVNGTEFATHRKEVESSDLTMVRDTPTGLRYLVKDPNGERVVKTRLAESKLFAVGGVFYDDSLPYPLPLAGINYFSFDFRHTGDQVNLFFAGPLLTLDVSNPRLNGSHYDAGASLFAIAIPFTDNQYRNGKESVPEEIKLFPASFSLKLGRTLGDFWKFTASYNLLSSTYSRNDDTAKTFVLPPDNLLHSFSGRFTFARQGFTVAADGSWSQRSRWGFWGLPGNTEFNPNQRSFEHWDISATKNWYLPKFQKISAEVDQVGGSDLDRFSKYQFGFFGDTRIHGFKTDAVRATSATLSHVTYGFDFGSAFRLDAVVDAAIANDRESGLHDAFLAGTGLVGTVVGPWETILNLDVGTPLSGPTHGIVLYLVALKLFR
jgi:hypothetical protein